jgi:acetate kinase
VALLRDDVLVVNAGSTSLKLTVVDADDRARQVAAIAEAAGVAAVGHRLVHGGERFIAPTRIDDDVVAALDGLRELAPLHNAPAVDAIADARRALPQIPQVAVFDTAFHATIPEVATTYLLPERFRRLGIRRYGFHGLSVAWVAEQVPAHRLVVCHLGGGCSVTAVDHGHSVDTTMGFTPLEGVPMATRAGSVDPGALLYLLRHGVGVEELDAALEHDSGWQALGGTADMEELLRSSAVGARVALDVFTYRVAQAVAAMTTALAGIDALAFTGGIGEHAAPVRRQICGRLGWLGIELDERANDHGTGDVAATDAPVRVHVVPAREDVMVARAVRGLLFSP